MKNYCSSPVSLMFLLCIYWTCTSCTPPQEQSASTSPASTISIPEYTQHDGELIALMDNSMTSYFIYKGQPMGFEYEMLSLFAKENNLKLTVKIINQTDHILDSLYTGVGDIAAANLTISEERKQKVAFSRRLFRTKTVLVQRIPDHEDKLNHEQIENMLVRDRLDLVGDTVTVRKNSSYELLLNNLISETGMDLHIRYAPGDLATESLVDMVSVGSAKFTLCDLNKAIIYRAYYDNIDIQTPMGLSQPVAWAVNKQSIKLLQTLNEWIEKRKGSLQYNLIYNKYFDLNRRKEKIIAHNFEDIKEGKISAYDNLIESKAKILQWDWHLLAALIYQESHFDPHITSWRGAVGLMQLMPATAAQYGIQPNQLQRPADNLEAGVLHLAYLQKYWSAQLPNSLETIKFVLGSYNVGLGHVQDAVRLAKAHKLDPNRWDDNVAQMLLNKSIPSYYMSPVVKYGYCRGKEPVEYVRNILKLYKLYRQYAI